MGGSQAEVILNVVDSPPALRFPISATVNSLSSFSVANGVAAGPVPAVAPRHGHFAKTAVTSESQKRSSSPKEPVKAVDSPSREGSLRSDVEGAGSALTGTPSPRESPAQQHAETPNSREYRSRYLINLNVCLLVRRRISRARKNHDGACIARLPGRSPSGREVRHPDTINVICNGVRGTFYCSKHILICGCRPCVAKVSNPTLTVPGGTPVIDC